MTIYFIREDNERRLIKVGFTKSEVAKRLHQLQNGSPDKLVLLTTIEGDETTESELHIRFSASRHRGEWFYPTSELLELIKTNAPKPKPKRKYISNFLPREK